MSAQATTPRPFAAKVPEITVLFWIIKILTTGTGEAASEKPGNGGAPWRRSRRGNPDG